MVSDTAAPAGMQAWDYPLSNWNRAAMSPPQVDPFCCRTEWQLSFHEARAPDRELIVREVPGSLVAFADQRHPVFGPLLSARVALVVWLPVAGA